MNVQKFWTSTVERILITSRCSHADAWRAAAKFHPDAAILMRSTGQTRQMIQFFNSKLPAGPSVGDESRREFANAVDAHMRKTGVSYLMAFRHVSSTRPQFFNSMSSVEITMPGQKKTGQVNNAPTAAHMTFDYASGKLRMPGFTNADQSAMDQKLANTEKGVPIASPQFKALFRLPPTTTDAEWAAAWAGNHNVPSPVNFGRVFDSLCELAQNQTSADYETALRNTKARFPDLWSAVDQLSQMNHMS